MLYELAADRSFCALGRGRSTFEFGSVGTPMSAFALIYFWGQKDNGSPHHDAATIASSTATESGINPVPRLITAFTVLAIVLAATPAISQYRQ
jgi:hypothetical protein